MLVHAHAGCARMRGAHACKSGHTGARQRCLRYHDGSEDPPRAVEFLAGAASAEMVMCSRQHGILLATQAPLVSIPYPVPPLAPPVSTTHVLYSLHHTATSDTRTGGACGPYFNDFAHARMVVRM